ncbi:MAG: class I SAM-dependent methyltransferase [Rickettsiales bacterium]
MTDPIEAYSNFYMNDSVNKAGYDIPESFIARVFLSKSPVKLLKNYNTNNKSILDVGCGNGRNIPFFKSLGLKTVGTEVSKDNVSKLKRKFPNSSFYHCYSDNMEMFKDNNFEFVVAVNSIYYLRQGCELIDNINESIRILKPGGALIMSFIGNKHFIMKNAKRDSGNNVIISSDPLSFRNGLRLRPIWSQEDLEKLLEKFTTIFKYKTGEILDKVDDVTRHILYVVCYKK